MKSLKENNLIETESTLDQALAVPIDYTRQTGKARQQREDSVQTAKERVISPKSTKRTKNEQETVEDREAIATA